MIHVLMEFLPVADALGSRAVHGQFAQIFDESSRVSHRVESSWLLVIRGCYRATADAACRASPFRRGVYERGGAGIQCNSNRFDPQAVDRGRSRQRWGWAKASASWTAVPLHRFSSK